MATEDGVVAVSDVGKVSMAAGVENVLSGIIGGLPAQKLSLYDVDYASCVIHDATADRLAVEMPTLCLYVNPKLSA